MNEDYLWDKSGEPDGGVEELERKLGRLRFQPSAHPLALPREAPIASLHRRNFSPVLAIAATLLILLLAGGVWLGLHDSIFNDGKIQQVADSGPRPPIGPIDPTKAVVQPQAHQPGSTTTPAIQAARFNSNRRSVERRRELIATRTSINKARALREQQLARAGEEAKAQLIKALSITSDTLNAVQRKMQGEPEERRPIS